MAKTVIYRTHNLQSHFDLAVQLYGDISKIGEILIKISDINGNIPIGTIFTIPEQTDPQAIYFKNKVVATDFITNEEDDVTFDSTVYTFDSTVLTFDRT